MAFFAGIGAAGKHGILLKGGNYLEALAKADTAAFGDCALKDGAAEAVAELKTLGIRRTVLLTGDNRAAAELTAKQTGISEVIAGLTPGAKVDALDKIMSFDAGKGKTLFVGTERSDAPALARADAGITFGAGGGAAMEAAGAVIMTDEPAKLPAAVRIARKCLSIVSGNIVFVLLIKIFLVGLQFGLYFAGLLPAIFLLLAEFADVVIALIAIGFSMTILKYDPNRK